MQMRKHKLGKMKQADVLRHVTRVRFHAKSLEWKKNNFAFNSSSATFNVVCHQNFVRLNVGHY